MTVLVKLVQHRCVMAACHLLLRQLPSYSIDRPFGTGLAGVQVGEVLGVGLVAFGDLLLLPGFLVSVPGQHAGVLLAGVAGQLVAVWQLAG